MSNLRSQYIFLKQLSVKCCLHDFTHECTCRNRIFKERFRDICPCKQLSWICVCIYIHTQYMHIYLCVLYVNRCCWSLIWNFIVVIYFILFFFHNSIEYFIHQTLVCWVFNEFQPQDMCLSSIWKFRGNEERQTINKKSENHFIER